MLDYSAIRRATVNLRGVPVGVLEKQATDRYSFQYSSEYLASNHALPIAFSFPLRPAPYLAPHLHPFFDNMILEGWLLSRAERILHIDKKNRFALLMACGRAPMGAVSVHPIPDAPIAPPERDFPTRLEEIASPNRGGNCPACLRSSPKGRVYHPRCASALWATSRKLRIELDAEQPLETFSKTIYGGSISGAQRKGLFRLNTKTWIIEADPIHSEFIFKPDGDYPELPANEHLTMSIARAVGFSVPPSTLIEIPSLGYVFVVRRFDRTTSGAPRMMQDMAQIIGESSEDKYEGSYEKVAEAIRRHASAPIIDLNEFLRRLVFCFLTANADMHLKNWSLIEKTTLDGQFNLSPCYDFLNTRLPIPRESIDIGLSIRGKKRNLQGSYFQKFASETLGTDRKYLERLFNEIPAWIKAIREFVPRSYLSIKSQQKYLKIVEERYAELISKEGR